MAVLSTPSEHNFLAKSSTMHLILGAAGIVAGYFLFRILYALFLSPLKDIPGPFLSRFTRLWELRATIRGDWHKTITDLHKEHGPVVRISPNLYSFNSPEDQKKIYTLKAEFVKTPYYRAAGHPYLINIFSLEDEGEHADRKKRLANLYSMSSMVNYEEPVDRMNAICMRKFDDFARRGQKVLIPEFMQCYAFDVIGEITLDQNFGMMEAEGDVDDMISLVHAGIKYQGTVGLFPEFHKAIFHIGNLLGIRHTGRAITKAADETLAKYRQLEQKIEKLNPKMDPFITKLIKLQDAGKVEYRHMLDAIGGNIAAGSDTTAITLSAALYYIYRTPRVLEALRKEIDERALEGQISDPVSFAEAQAMPYLQAVIMETLRLHPAVGYVLPRIVPKGGAELAGRFFPEGTQVGVSAWALHLNQDVYGSDAKEFKPERFLNQKSGAAQLGNSFAFGGGTRTCLGKNISLLEMTKVLPQIVRKFDLVMEEGKDWELFTTWFVWQKYYCYIKPRGQ